MPKLEVLQFTPKNSFINETGRSQGHVQKVSKGVYMSMVVVSPDPLSPTPRNSSPVKTPEDIEKDLYDAESAI
jgi:hypothetical protein